MKSNGKTTIVASIEPKQIMKELALTIPSADLSSETEQNTNISNLVGEFFQDNKRLKKNSISSIINELLTNGLKYSDADSDIKLNSYATNGTFCVLMENVCSPPQLKYLNKYMKTVIQSNKPAIDLYIERSIALSESHSLKRAQLGLISLMSNFGCTLDIQTQDINGLCIVSTTVSFNGMVQQ